MRVRGRFDFMAVERGSGVYWERAMVRIEKIRR